MKCGWRGKGKSWNVGSWETGGKRIEEMRGGEWSCGEEIRKEQSMYGKRGGVKRPVQWRG
jgi:hypothetical protein